jgi:hypothetical protein
MHEENHSYGHAEILLKHAGIRFPLPLPGRLQHGWQPGLGFGFQLEALERLSEPWPSFVWSRRNLEQCQALGFDRVIPIGAPFLYMPDAAPVESLGEKSLLAFPFHGWAEEKVHGNPAAYADSLDALVNDGFGPVTVCLYHLEYDERAVRTVFEQRGFRVVTNGPRYGNPGFLFKQRQLLMSHRYATSNMLGTAAFYALVAGCRFFLHGPPMGLGRGWDPTGEETARRQKTEFPQLNYETFYGQCHKAIGLRELGHEFVCSPRDLRMLFLRSLGRTSPRLWVRRLTRRALRWLDQDLDSRDERAMALQVGALLGPKLQEADYIQMRLSLARSLRRYRQERLLSRTQIAQLVGVSPTDIENLELCRAFVPLDLLVRCHLLLGTTRREIAEIIASSQ